MSRPSNSMRVGATVLNLNVSVDLDERLERKTLTKDFNERLGRNAEAIGERETAI